MRRDAAGAVSGNIRSADERQIGHYACVSNDAEPSVADEDSVVIARCLRAAVEGPFFLG